MKKILLCLFLFSNLFAQEGIYIYNCYANSKRLTVHGRVLNERKFQETKKEDNIFVNFIRKMGYIFNDEKKDVNITMRIDQKNFSSVTDDEGYFEFDLSFDKKTFYQNQKIIFYLTKEKKIRTICQPYIPSDKEQTGIISDFDDTVIISDVTNKISLAYELLLKNYKQRQAVKNMASLYKEILKKSPDRPLFFITGSPNQFNEVINAFLDFHRFPKRTVITKKIHGKNSYSIFKQKEYKSNKIKKLIKLYPNIKWALFGDSGEQDRSVYLDIAAKFPSHIKEIYIRDIKSGRLKKIFPYKSSN